LKLGVKFTLKILFFAKRDEVMLRKSLAAVSFLVFVIFALLSGIAGREGGFKSWITVWGIAMAFGIGAIALWPFKQSPKSE
jgi:hypothetical protein